MYLFYTDVCKEFWALASVGKLCECGSLNLSFLICKMEMVRLSLKLGRNSIINVFEHSMISTEHLLRLCEGHQVKSLNRTESIPAFSEGDMKGNDIQKAPGMGAWYIVSAW